jgi:CheY-like chemotaxis protein
MVLWVDDDEFFLQVARKCLLTEGGLDVEIAFSIFEAFKKMEKINPDAIIGSCLDAEENLFVFLKELRSKGIKTPFIALIADNEKDLALKARDLGANGVVTKFGEPAIIYPLLKKLIMSLVEPSGGISES